MSVGLQDQQQIPQIHQQPLVGFKLCTWSRCWLPMRLLPALRCVCEHCYWESLRDSGWVFPGPWGTSE